MRPSFRSSACGHGCAERINELSYRRQRHRASFELATSRRCFVGRSNRITAVLRPAGRWIPRSCREDRGPASPGGCRPPFCWRQITDLLRPAERPRLPSHGVRAVLRRSLSAPPKRPAAEGSSRSWCAVGARSRTASGTPKSHRPYLDNRAAPARDDRPARIRTRTSEVGARDAPVTTQA
jgi:hypothetical protein